MNARAGERLRVAVVFGAPNPAVGRRVAPAMDTYDFLRAKARQCRDFASYHEGDAADGLRRMADELEAKADELQHALVNLVDTLHPGIGPRAHCDPTQRYPLRW